MLILKLVLPFLGSVIAITNPSISLSNLSPLPPSINSHSYHALTKFKKLKVSKRTFLKNSVYSLLLQFEKISSDGNIGALSGNLEKVVEEIKQIDSDSINPTGTFKPIPHTITEIAIKTEQIIISIVQSLETTKQKSKRAFESNTQMIMNLDDRLEKLILAVDSVTPGVSKSLDKLLTPVEIDKILSIFGLGRLASTLGI